ncbi:hypothetical protein EUBDOL_01215 [Amedibacillus dolichus DSM 3991]|uniref:Uncharacterized protein n=1 Tax=Amedibacillus dolichus DSM 3991 TaxID=428127 RepID=A8RBY3_9FIRM|nr:hypothetical protein EUBDOL_01215 [Amedibacillus dolichus DSM 3991]
MHVRLTGSLVHLFNSYFNNFTALFTHHIYPFTVCRIIVIKKFFSAEGASKPALCYRCFFYFH